MFVVILLVGTLSPEAFGQAAQAMWTARYDGPPVNASDAARTTVVDSAGNIYVTGTASTEGMFTYRSDWVTVKYDPDGSELWEARCKGLGAFSSEKTLLEVDILGNVYVSIATLAQEQGSPGSYITVKYDSAGNELWAERYNHSGSASIRGLAVDYAGNVYMSGSSFTGDGSSDHVLIKYDPSGNRLWVVHMEHPGYDLVVDSAGNILSTGLGSTVQYDPQGNELWTTGYDGRSLGLALDSADNVYVTGSIKGENDDDYISVKYDSAGTELWRAIYDGPDHDEDKAYHLVVDGEGNVFVSGTSQGDLTGINYATVKYDPAGNQLWAARYDSPDLPFDRPQALAVDSAGNVYVIGSSEGSNGKDYATVKYDFAGTELWVVVYDGPGHGDDSAYSMAMDPTGNIVVTGGVFVTSMFLFYHDNNDYGTVKYDPDGNQLWVVHKNNMAPGEDMSYDVATDEAGNVYVTGINSTVKYNSQGSQLWAVTDGGGLLAVDAGGNVYVIGTNEQTVKYDPDGVMLWAVADGANNLVLDPSGDIFVACHVEKPVIGWDFEGRKYDPEGNLLWTVSYSAPGGGNYTANLIETDAVGNFYVTGDSGEYTTFTTIKYDPDGNELWVARYDGRPDSWQNIPQALAVDEAGNVYVTGMSYGPYNRDYATIKYDPAGNELWVARYNGPNDLDDYPRAIGVDGAGNVYVAGDSGSYAVSIYMELTDYVIIKYDSAGNQLWADRYNGPLPTPFSDESVAGMVVDPSGNVYVTGSTAQLLDTGNSDYATLKYHTDGHLIWAVTYDGQQGKLDMASSLALDSLGNVYVTGGSNTSATGLDYLTIKYTEAPGWAPAATLPGTSAPVSRAVGWLFCLSLPLLALAVWKRTRMNRKPS